MVRLFQIFIYSKYLQKGAQSVLGTDSAFLRQPDQGGTESFAAAADVCLWHFSCGLYLENR